MRGWPCLRVGVVTCGTWRAGALDCGVKVVVFAGGFGVDGPGGLALVLADDVVVPVLTHLVVDIPDQGQASFHP